MISPFEVYLVLQLNSLVGASVLIAIISACGATLALILPRMEYRPDDDDIARWDRRAKKVLKIGSVALLLSVVVPSSKTAAAMFILPALTSDQVIEPVSREAKELYGLAKKALQNAVNEKPESAK